MSELQGLTEADITRIADVLGERLGVQSGRTAGGAGAPSRTKSEKKKKSRDLKFLTDAECEALFRAIRADKSVWAERNLAVFEVGYHRGLRASEVGLIETGHIQRGRIYVSRIKNGISNWYIATEREEKALRAWLKVRARLKLRGNTLFVSRHNRPISRQELNHLIRKYGAAAGIAREKCHFHVLRHTCAMTLLNTCQARIEEVQDHLGHVDITNTMIYAKLSDKSRERLGTRIQREW